VGVVCRMQDHEQKDRPVRERVGYVNPYLINQSAMAFEPEHDDKAKLHAITDEKEREEELIRMRKKHEASFTLYIALALVQFKRRRCVVLPYNFK
jgi:hypothetical protein